MVGNSSLFHRHKHELQHIITILSIVVHNHVLRKCLDQTQNPVENVAAKNVMNFNTDLHFGTVDNLDEQRVILYYIFVFFIILKIKQYSNH